MSMIKGFIKGLKISFGLERPVPRLLHLCQKCGENLSYCGTVCIRCQMPKGDYDD